MYGRDIGCYDVETVADFGTPQSAERRLNVDGSI